ncbi:MAG: hypothetical protein PWP23_1047 [Candidatus Sumerlaeota bacterium]|nr:hypothetical protein [Candidatus Sumerlaeota bacterium]
MRRLDPILAAEDSNALFMAFRLRRTEHARSLRTLLRRRGSIPPMQIFMALGLVGAVIVLFRLVSCCAIPIVAGLAALFARSFQRTRIVGGRLPARLSSVFSTSGYMEEAAIDLWLAGAKGREVLEAIYLERREASKFGATGIVLLLSVLGFGLYLYVAHPWHIGGYVIFASLTCLVAQLVPFTLVSGISSVRTNSLEPRLAAWQAESAWDAGLKAGLRRAGLAVLTIIATFLSIWVLTFVIVLLVRTFSSPFKEVPLPAFLSGYAVEFTIALSFGVIALVLKALQGTLRRRFLHRLERTLAEADYAFDRFMAAVVVGDPVGADWARWVYYIRTNQQQLVPDAPPDQPPPEQGSAA